MQNLVMFGLFFPIVCMCADNARVEQLNEKDDAIEKVPAYRFVLAEQDKVPKLDPKGDWDGVSYWKASEQMSKSTLVSMLKGVVNTTTHCSADGLSASFVCRVNRGNDFAYVIELTTEEGSDKYRIVMDCLNKTF